MKRFGFQWPMWSIVLMSSPALAGIPADLLLDNGKILTIDSKSSISSAVVVKDGKILAIGGPEIAKRYTASKVIDLKGRMLLPGFTDSHVHIQAMAGRAIDMAGLRSIADLQNRLRAKAMELGPGQWITGSGWDEALFSEKRNPSKVDLDAATPNNPVVLTRAGGHSAVGNSMAIKIAGIDRNTPDPEFGVIEKDSAGEPNGIIREANNLYYKHVPREKWDSLRPSLFPVSTYETGMRY